MECLIVNKFIIAVVCLVLLGCSKSEHPSKVTTEFKTTSVEVIDINRPKHFSVHVKALDGSINQRLSTTKYCSNWRNIEYGVIYELEYQTSTYYDGAGNVFKTVNHFPSSCVFVNKTKVLKYKDVT